MNAMSPGIIKRMLVIAGACVFIVFAEAGANAQEGNVPKADHPTVYREKDVTITATVQAIDLKKRIVTVKGGPKEQVVELKVDEKAGNLSRLKVGDRVVVKYIESVAVRVMKPGEVKVKETETKVVVEGPGTEERQTTVTATIQDIDRNTNNVFLKWPGGATVGMHVKDPQILEDVKVGDQVVITYTDTVAISIEKADQP
jgi:Cu/Ag efflux protein CusF